MGVILLVATVKTTDYLIKEDSAEECPVPGDPFS